MLTSTKTKLWDNHFLILIFVFFVKALHLHPPHIFHQYPPPSWLPPRRSRLPLNRRSPRAASSTRTRPSARGSTSRREPRDTNCTRRPRRPSAREMSDRPFDFLPARTSTSGWRPTPSTSSTRSTCCTEASRSSVRRRHARSCALVPSTSTTGPTRRTPGLSRYEKLPSQFIFPFRMEIVIYHCKLP
jgi:hypothetical protein